MRYHVVAIVLLAPILGCSNVVSESTEKADANFPVGPVPKGSISDDQMDLVGKGVDLRQFDTDPTTGTPRRPTIWIHAETFTITDKDIWSFQKAHAVIYGKDEDDEEITFDAGEGKFQETKMALLKGGVVGQVGDMKLELSDIRWLNDENVAQTESAVSIISPDSNLKADSMHLYPKQKQLILTNVTGLIRFEGNQP